ncbi:MAG: DUF3667 domain-containing protein [Flavobacteriales bacterium]|nr:DUF3667 domain-containing protein [Flavobacteriales bacterium]
MDERRCESCGTKLLGDWCHLCGQKVQDGRFTVRKSLITLANTIVNVERGFFYTSIMMFKSPGVVIADYIRGNTRPYMHPVRYAFTLLTIGLIVFQFYDIPESSFLMAEHQENNPFPREKVLEFAMKYSNFISLIVFIPFMGWASWIVNRKTRTNYAEHIIAMLYVVGHNVLYGLLLTPLVLLSNDQLTASSIVTLLAYVLVIYQINGTWLENRRSMALIKAVAVPVLGFIALVFSVCVLVVVGVLIAVILGKLWN